MTGNDESQEDVGSASGLEMEGSDRRQDPRVEMASQVTLRIRTSVDHGPTAGGEAETRTVEFAGFADGGETAEGQEDRGELVRASASGDVSLGGMFLVSAEPIAPGTKVEVSFDLPELESEMSVPGEVRWVLNPAPTSVWRRWKFGIEFAELSGDEEERLRSFVERKV